VVDGTDRLSGVSVECPVYLACVWCPGFPVLCGEYVRGVQPVSLASQPVARPACAASQLAAQRVQPAS